MPLNGQQSRTNLGTALWGSLVLGGEVDTYSNHPGIEC